MKTNFYAVTCSCWYLEMQSALPHRSTTRINARVRSKNGWLNPTPEKNGWLDPIPEMFARTAPQGLTKIKATRSPTSKIWWYVRCYIILYLAPKDTIPNNSLVSFLLHEWYLWLWWALHSSKSERIRACRLMEEKANDILRQVQNSTSEVDQSSQKLSKLNTSNTEKHFMHFNFLRLHRDLHEEVQPSFL